MSIEESAMQFWKTFIPIFLTEAGMAMEWRE
jgi:hypothetical protein